MIPVLVVEDDANVGEGLVAYLATQGFEAWLARSLAEARALVPRGPAAIVLDWMLPDGQGVDLLTELRAAGLRAPVLFLTARSDLVDRVVGLEAGASDYMVKPFEPRELVARLRAQLRASGGPAPALEASGIRLDPARREVTAAGRPVMLTPKEFLLLELFLANPGRVYSREELLTRVWGYEQAPSTRTVDTHVLQLRQKLGDTLFETVRGFGYRFRGEAPGA
jgi:DNA-binding response OmpR family regulator